MGAFFLWLLNFVILVAGVVLVLLILIQRGRGGGLIGALGGQGGSSPFGSRAGDTFTRVTLGLALTWMVLLMLQIWIIQPDPKPKDGGGGGGGGGGTLLQPANQLPVKLARGATLPDGPCA